MNKVAVLIAAHCKPKILKLTLGTLLDAYDGSYEIKVFVALHRNYEHYYNPISDITDMPYIDFSFVPEIEWNKHGLMRFSVQHSMSLKKLLQKASRNMDFTHAAIFDHDLVFKSDFISWAFREYPDAEWVLSLFDDIEQPRSVRAKEGIETTYAPKPSIWHMLLAKSLVDKVMEDRAIVVPEQIGRTVYDTFAKVYEMARCEWGTKMEVLPSHKMDEMIQHLWSLSFNFGYVNATFFQSPDQAHNTHNEKIRAAEQMYDERFPNGIAHLLPKLK